MSNPSDGASLVFNSLKNWLAQPYDTSMNTTHWFLFAGLVLVILGVWFMILREIKGAIE